MKNSKKNKIIDFTQHKALLVLRERLEMIDSKIEKLTNQYYSDGDSRTFYDELEPLIDMLNQLSSDLYNCDNCVEKEIGTLNSKIGNSMGKIIEITAQLYDEFDENLLTSLVDKKLLLVYKVANENLAKNK